MHIIVMYIYHIHIPHAYTIYMYHIHVPYICAGRPKFIKLLKICWTAWNLTFSHRFGTIFSQGWKIFRDAYDAMVKTTYFQLIRTKKRILDRKKTPEANKKPEPNAVSRHQNEVSRHQRSIEGAFRCIQEHRKDRKEVFKAVPEA